MTSSAQPRVWLAADADADTLAALFVGFRDHFGKTEPTREQFLQRVQHLLARDDTDFLLGAPPEGKAAGFCQVRYRPTVWGPGDDAWLEDLYVGEEARGAGLGSALVRAAIARARERGCWRMELDTNEQNPALALYERLGFSPQAKGPGRDLFLGRRLV